MELREEKGKVSKNVSFSGTFQNDDMIVIFSQGIFPGAIVRTIP